MARAFLRLLRERTTAELYAVDVSFYTMAGLDTIEETNTFAELFREFDVHFVNGIEPPHKMVQVPGGGLMFEQYLMPDAAVDVDEFVSVAVLKNHQFMGVTMALKNLFGLMPGAARPRHYYQHIERMPYMLVDMGKMVNPTLNIIDGLVTQAGREWGYKGEDFPRICNTLVAGDHIIATDACGAYLMGHDPKADWLTPPFHRDRNPLLVAAEGGFGTVDLDEIDFESEVQAPVGEFFAVLTDRVEINISWRRTTAEQGLYYRDNRQKFYDQYAGEFILLQQGQVRWHDPSGNLRVSRRLLAGDNPDQAMFFKYVDPAETEGEHYEVYERTLRKEMAELAQM